MKDPHKLNERTTEVLDLQKITAVAEPPSLTVSSYEASAATNADTDAPLRYYWRVVRKHRWLILGLTTLITVLAAVYMWSKPNVYAAEAQLQVDLENATSAFGSVKSNSVVVSGPVNDPVYFNTQLKILTSPGLLRRVVKALDLEHNEAFLRRSPSRSGSILGNLRSRIPGFSGRDSSGEQNQLIATEDMQSGAGSSAIRANLVSQHASANLCTFGARLSVATQFSPVLACGVCERADVATIQSRG